MKLGIIGLNEGNGHPYSYSAIFNGYDPDALEKECPYELIRQYLPREHKNENSIPDATVTHIWTQDTDLSHRVARVSRIPNVVSSYEDLIGKVDGVILARDDIENHLSFAKPFLAHGMPLFIDKQLTHTAEDLSALLKLCGRADYPLMACSPIRFNPEIQRWRSYAAGGTALAIQGICRVNWLRYAHHLYEAIAVLFGTDVDTVRYLGFNEEHQLFAIQYNSGLTVTLEFHKRVSLPIRCFVNFEEKEPLEIRFENFFQSFRGMLQAFVSVVETKAPCIPIDEIAKIACIVLAGEISAKEEGSPIKVHEVWERYAR